MENEQLNMNIANSKLQPIYADNTAIAVKMKMSKNEKGDVEKEGQIELIFIDMLTQQPIGEFVIGRLTAKELITGLTQNLANLEKELKSKDIPKPPEIKPTSNSSYR